MSAAPASRAVILRQPRQLLRRPQFRNASTASEAASKAKDSAQSTVTKASEGLSKVQSSAGSAVSGVAASAQNALSKVGGRTGRMIKFVESLVPPTIYYGRVGLELGRLMVNGQKMAPPSTSQIQAYFQPLMNMIRQPGQIASAARTTSPEGVLSSARNINSQQLGALAVVGAEILGFFTVGTMIGRLKIVGYHGSVHHDEH